MLHLKRKPVSPSSSVERRFYLILLSKSKIVQNWGLTTKLFFKELNIFSEEGKSVLLSSSSSLWAIKQFQLCCQQKSRKMSPPIPMSVCSADTSIEWTPTPELTALIIFQSMRSMLCPIVNRSWFPQSDHVG